MLDYKHSKENLLDKILLLKMVNQWLIYFGVLTPFG